MTLRAAWVLAVAAACGGRAAQPPEPEQPAAAPDPARAAFERLEHRLTGASRVELTARVTATGHIGARLDGTLLIEGDRVLLGFEGAFQDEPVKLSLTSDGRAMSGGTERLSFAHDAPPALQEGLMIGLTRMGLLHNLAVLTSGNPPHGAFGDARDWVTVHDVRRVDDHLAFEIEVEGKRTASAALWLDPDTRLPARRRQTVRFPGGTMQVVEVYERFSVR